MYIILRKVINRRDKSSEARRAGERKTWGGNEAESPSNGKVTSSPMETPR